MTEREERVSITETPCDREEKSISITAARLRMIVGVLERRIRKRGDDLALSCTQTAVLGRLSMFGPMAAVDLATMEMTRPQTMRNLIDSLRDEGLIEGSRDPIDGRRVILTLTSEGRDRIRGAYSGSASYLGEALTRLTDGERDQLRGALGVLERLAFPERDIECSPVQVSVRQCRFE
ncbi:MarR family transcriptional regulator [Nocardia terpenica]